VGAAKTAVESTVVPFTSIGELHDNNSEEATARGAQFSVAVLGSDARNPNNPHVTQGRAYTVQEMERRVRDIFGLEIQRLMPWMKIMNSSGADKQLQQGIGVVVRQLNNVLQRAETPAQRHHVIRTFVQSATHQITDAYRKRGSGGYGSR
jgi:hypothetical protein